MEQFAFIVNKMETALAEQKTEMALNPEDDRRIRQQQDTPMLNGELSIIYAGLARAKSEYFFASCGLLKGDERGPEMNYLKFLRNLQWVARKNPSDSVNYFLGRTLIVDKWVEETEIALSVKN